MSLPLVSVLIPIRNEADHIGPCLEAVLSQDYPSNLIEVLIADGNSTDGTLELLAEWQKRDNRIRIFENPKQIVPTGMNILIPKAAGEIIIRVDGHTKIALDYVRRCVIALQESGVENVGGKMNAIGATDFGMAVAEATSHPFGIGNAKFHYSERQEEVDSIYMGAWPRKVFEESGLFDEELVRNQDDEFNYRIRENGGKLLLHPEIKSIYTVRSTPGALWKQYFQYGYWKVRVLQKHPRQMSLRQFVPPIFVLTICLALVASLVFPWGWILLAAIIGAYGIAALIASGMIAKSNGWHLLGLIPLAFVIIHMSYGSGFLIGMVMFWNRWGDKAGKVPEW